MIICLLIGIDINTDLVWVHLIVFVCSYIFINVMIELLLPKSKYVKFMLKRIWK